MPGITLKIESTNELMKRIKWFADVHISSRVDVVKKNNGIELINALGNKLVIPECSCEEVYKMLVSDDYLYDTIFEKCTNQVKAIEKVITDRELTNKELFNIYLEATEYTQNSEPAWYVSDINMIPDDVGEWFTINIALSVNPRHFDIDYKELKDVFENRIYEVYKDLLSRYYKGLEIPIYDENGEQIHVEEYLRIIGKMFFALKGACVFSEDDSLELRRRKIIDEKYASFNSNEFNRPYMQHPREIENDIEEVTYVFPKEESWPEVMKCMGLFHADEKSDANSIMICEGNIRKTIRFMLEDKAFSEKVTSPIVALYNTDNLKRIEDLIYVFLNKMVFAHECGHLVFKSIRRDLSLTENESLANWFACLVGTQFDEELIHCLVPYQYPEYQDFVVLPRMHSLEKKSYFEYCKKIGHLLRSW